MKKPEKQKTVAQQGPTAPPKGTEAITRPDPPASPKPEDLTVLPIERVTMPTDDISDLRDVVDAINRLCETMKTSDYDDSDCNNDSELCEDVEVEVKIESEVELVSPEEIVVSEVETYVAELWSDAAALHVETVDDVTDSQSLIDNVSTLTLDSHPIRNEDSNRSNRDDHVETVPLDLHQSNEGNIDSVGLNSFLLEVENAHVIATNKSMTQVENVCRESVGSEPLVIDQEPFMASMEPVSEMYYTASSEVSLLSDAELADRIQEEAMEGREGTSRDDRNGVMAGHVAAMRERFESMTRANTPCPDVMRSASPSLDVYRNITPSPDHLG